ncbi:MAG: hypothetical protein U0175_35490 [Caldilineaceae bacterium]
MLLHQLNRRFHSALLMRADRKAEMANIDLLPIRRQIDAPPRRRHPLDTDKYIHGVCSFTQ